MAQIRKNGLCRRPNDFIRSRTTRVLLSAQLIDPTLARARRRAASGAETSSNQNPAIRRRAREAVIPVGRSHDSVSIDFKKPRPGAVLPAWASGPSGCLWRVIVRGVLA